MIKFKKNKIIPKSSGFVYELDSIDSDIVNTFLAAKEGIFTIEQLSNIDYQEIYAHVPNTERLKCPVRDKSWSYFADELDEITLYELQLKEPSFLPLYCKESIDVFNSLETPGTVLSQLLITKVIGNWRDVMISQYEDYLKGNDYPSTSKLIRKFQTKVLSGLNKLGDFNIAKENIPDAESKILDINYKVEMRFVLLEGDSVQFEKQLNDLLKKVSYYNELDLVKVRDKKHLFRHIVSREFQSHLNNQLSQQEIQCLFSSETPVMKKEIKVSNPVTIQSNHIADVLEFLPKVDTVNRNLDDSVAKLLVDSFKRTKITNKQLKINSLNRGATLQKVTLTIPNDIVYTNIEKNLKNIQSALGNNSISMEIGDVPDTVDFYIPCEDRDVVYLRSILSSQEFVEYAKTATLPLILGEDSIGHPLFSDLEELKHILIAGATGSGKSVYLNALILTLLMYKSPSELKMILIDPKQVELKPFAKYPHATFISDMDKVSGVFVTLINEMENRYTLMADKGCRNITQYNNKSKIPLPYIVCIVDELSDLMDTNGKEIENHIIRLGQKARAAGLHLVLCTQKPSVDVITTRIKSNLPSAISFRLKAQSDYKTVFGRGVPFNLLGKGDGVVMLEGSSKEFIRFQSPVIDLNEDKVVDIIDDIAYSYSGVECDQFEIVEKEEPLDQIKRIIACTGETRISALRDEMKIRINLVSDLVKQLVDEGWLIKEGKGYKVIADEGELNKWREVAE